MEDLPNEIEFKINDILKSNGYKTYKQVIATFENNNSNSTIKKGECLLCKEKDERIADLKETIKDLKENMNTIKEINKNFKGIIDSQQSVIQSLQIHIDDLQQHQLDTGKDVKSQAG